MLVLCNTCHNHYDDTCQTPVCSGINQGTGNRSGVVTSHKMTDPQTPVESHIDNTRAAWSMLRARESTKADPAPAVVPTSDAAPSDD